MSDQHTNEQLLDMFLFENSQLIERLEQEQFYETRQTTDTDKIPDATQNNNKISSNIPALDSQESHSPLTQQSIISVSVAKLDKLMDLLGEMDCEKLLTEPG